MEIKSNEVYTPEEVQRILKISASTVARMIKRGDLPCTRVGRQYRIFGQVLLHLFSPAPKPAPEQSVYSLGKIS